MIISFSKPVTPVRGLWSFWTDKFVIFISVLLFIVLIFYVFDVTRTFRRFVELAGEKPLWPRGSVEKYCSQVVGLQDAGIWQDQGEGTPQVSEEGPLQDWMLIRLIAVRTEVLGKLIFYPFIVWLILFVSRLNYFDNWNMPLGLGIVITLGALCAWSSAFVLRRSAENARISTIKRLTKRLAKARMEKERGQGLIEQIEFAIKEIKSCQQGAFAPFTQHPVLQALFIPFGGVGGVYLLDFLSKLNI